MAKKFGAKLAGADKYFSAFDEQEVQTEQEVQAEQEVQTVHTTKSEQEVQEVIEKYEEQEVQETQEVHKVQGTQGRKGQKMKRINMAFGDENLEYINVMAKIQGKTMTKWVNDLIDKERADNQGIYEQIKKLANKI